MKIVHVYKDAFPPLAAGITRYIAMVAAAAAEAGHEVEVHAAGVRTSRSDILPAGVRVHRWAEWGRLLSNPVSPALIRAVTRIRADVVHVHMPNPVGEVGAVALDAPIISSFHAQIGRQRLLEPVYRPLQQRLLARSSSVLVGSPAMAAQPEVAAHERRVTVLPYGVDPALVSAGEHPAPSGVLRLLFVGRLVYYKGVDVLLDAMVDLPGASLSVIGDGPLRGNLEQRVAGHPGLTGRVIFHGEVTDATLAAAYRAHDVFVAPSVSRAEAFGISMAEALSNGLPAVSTRLGTGTDWVNQDEVTGFVVEPQDAEGLRNAVTRLYEHSTWDRLSRGARALAQRRYSAEGHFTELMRHYERAVAS